MTPEQELIAAVLEARNFDNKTSFDAILTTPSVQAALAKVRDREPVLRWEEVSSRRNELYLGSNVVAFMSRSSISTQTRWHIYLTQETGLANNEDEAAQVVTQAVRDWLKRAGCV